VTSHSLRKAQNAFCQCLSCGYLHRMCWHRRLPQFVAGVSRCSLYTSAFRFSLCPATGASGSRSQAIHFGRHKTPSVSVCLVVTCTGCAGIDVCHSSWRALVDVPYIQAPLAFLCVPLQALAASGHKPFTSEGTKRLLSVSVLWLLAQDVLASTL